ncbi:MAG: hypothetical protein WKG00_04700 [Polyangiaceae bacterium]
MASAKSILDVLDWAAASFRFPMLDNGYVYLAATRLSLFRSVADWALVVEVFGFSPGGGELDVAVSTFASRLRDRNPPGSYVSRQAYENYLAQHPHDEFRAFSPVARGAWVDPEHDHLVHVDAAELLVRGESVSVPSAEDFARLEIDLSEPPRICVFELCRALAATRREKVLATAAERRVSVPEDLTELLRLDEWHHPERVASQLPSANETFQQLARVLESGDSGAYRPTRAPNTHWRNWPQGGRLI